MWREPLGTEASVPLGTRPWFLMVLEEVPMAIVGGLDLHRKQITFDVLDTVSGEVRRGRISPADRQLFRGWLTELTGQQVELAVEGCTGWRFVIEECQAAGVVAHLAEPAEVAGLRGRRRTPRPTGSMPGTCGICCWKGGYRSAGSRHSWCWRPGPRSGCTRTWPISAPVGSSACTPPCTTWAPRPSVICWSGTATG